MIRSLLLFFYVFLITNLAFANISNHIWKDVSESTLDKRAERSLIPEKYRTLQLNEAAIKKELALAPLENSNHSDHPLIMELPMPDGSNVSFEILEYKMMEAGLAAEFPLIKTYTGRAIHDPTTAIKLDISPNGLHGIIHSTNGSIFIDPYFRHNDGHYISYFKNDYKAEQNWNCEVHDAQRPVSSINDGSPRVAPYAVGETLRTYRIAVATSGEYSSFHGGNIASIQAAIVTVINRVNSVYERELSVRMVLVNNNSSLIFLNAASDPYGSSTSANITANHNHIVSTIGNSSFDVGHFFHTIGGGLASLESVCRSSEKGRGFSAFPTPVGDPFAVDYVCHELGHQFGANHTFNTQDGACSGNRAGASAYEPGSGVTLMGYAGLCPPSNFANDAIDRFHTKSFDEIARNITIATGSICGSTSATGNTPPTVNAGTSGKVIPISTPFELTGSATDAQGDALTYTWEQYDLGSPQSLGNASGSSPLFRSYQPSTSPTRVFPKIQDILFGISSPAELLPTYTRPLNFRLTVRDNNPNGGGVDWHNIALSSSANAGPFLVTSQKTSTTLTAGTWVEVTWDVANTTSSPVSCSFVDIFLSDNGGTNYPSTVITGTINDGSEYVVIPNYPGTGQRLKVKCSNNFFFNVNDGFIIVEEAPNADYSVFAPNATKEICAGNGTSFDLYLNSLKNYTDVVNFTATGNPAGTTLNFTSSSVTPAGQTKLIITSTGSAQTGSYPIVVTTTSTSGTKTYNLTLNIYNGTPGGTTLIAPPNGSSDQDVGPLFSWNAQQDASKYFIQVSSSSNFSPVLFSQANIAATNFQLPITLSDNSTYYWRVRSDNVPCGNGQFSPTYSFTTEETTCAQIASTDVPLVLPPTKGSYSTTNQVSINHIIKDINVIDLIGDHQNLGDIRFTLTSPAGTEVELIDRKCNNTADYNLNFDNDGGVSIPCPYNTGGTYKPSGSLGDFIGENTMGTWTLTLHDEVTFKYGDLTSWGLEFCFSQPVSNEDINSSISAINLYPNPASDQLVADLTSSKSQTVNLRLVNATGQLIKDLNTVRLAKGSQQIEIDLNGLANGVYFLQINNDKTSVIETKKFTVLK